MRKREAIGIITTCAAMYDKNLVNRNFLFVYGSEEQPFYMETVFLPRHFLHLTGVKLPEDKGNDPELAQSSVDFYQRALKHRLRESDFVMSNDGTVEMKLSVLTSLMNIHKVSKMVGTYDSSKALLSTEKLAGTVTACMGFVREKSSGYFVPNTALREDIRNITLRPQEKVLCVLQKEVKDATYTAICYKAKTVQLKDIPFSEKVVLPQEMTPAI